MKIESVRDYELSWGFGDVAASLLKLNTTIKGY